MAGRLARSRKWRGVNTPPLPCPLITVKYRLFSRLRVLGHELLKQEMPQIRFKRKPGRCVDVVGLPRFRFHDLRHTVITEGVADHALGNRSGAFVSTAD